MADPISLHGITVSGASALAILDAVKSFSVLVNELLQVMKLQTRDASGAPFVDPKAWYPAENYLPVYKKIDTLLGGRGLEKVGSYVPQNAIFPPDIQDLHKALAAIDVAYHMNHRKDGKPMFDPATGQMLEGIGHYQFHPTAGKNEAVLVSDTPYPCRFDLGLIKGMARRFQLQAETTHAPHPGCRLKGAASCTYVVTW
ncbi:hypothetical protein ACLESD_12960 [Pyxidicoccus sp. 3LFB2]